MTQNLCECGCGEPVVFYKYKPRRFIKGHQMRGKNNSHWKGGQCNPKEWYKKIWIPNHPYSHNNYVYIHRYVMEQFLGRYLTSDEIVHHKDKNIHNNNISNLELVTKTKHTSIHHPVLDRSDIFCKICGGKTYINAKGKEMWSGNKTDGYTCRKCFAKIYYHMTKKRNLLKIV